MVNPTSKHLTKLDPKLTCVDVTLQKSDICTYKYKSTINTKKLNLTIPRTILISNLTRAAEINHPDNATEN